MKASVILAHPYTKSFNHAIFHRAVSFLEERGITVFAHDLYAEGFNPVMTTGELGKEPTEDPLVERYVREFMESNLLVFIHPNWWGQPPAMMKGYIDRVVRPPHAYDFDEKEVTLVEGKLGSKRAVVFNTSNTPEEKELGYFHDPLESIWGRCVFGFCGLDNYARKMFRIVADSTEEVRKDWLIEVENMLDGEASS